jgi:iron complex outermembrane receptor protein
MKRTNQFRLLALALLPTLAAGQTGRTITLDEVVVTASPMDDPLTVTTDPKAPRQPLPAHDGADYLKTIPGFSVIRKGGTDGDPVFRGMAGSRLNILTDGETVLGGCGGRMDPPTAYIYPEAYDRITLIKGPQTVQWGAGNAAGVVLFERDFKRPTAPGTRLDASLMAASFGRNDQVVDYSAANADYSARLTGTHSTMGDYRDGAGHAVHSSYQRWSGNATLGWTPDADTRLQLSAGASDGEAAYADRTMDGVMFRRDNVGLKFQKKKISALVARLDAQVYYNYIDHVMDSYSLREVAAGGTKQVSNPDRETIGWRVATVLNLAAATSATVGIDRQENAHTLRFSGNQDRVSYESLARTDDAWFGNTGIFGELTQSLSERDRLVAGLRVDAWEAQDRRRGYATSGQTRYATLTSGFLRHERDYGEQSTYFAGIGHNERFPDYWELLSQGKQSASTNSAFEARPEKLTQIDVGTIYRPTQRVALSLSGFYGKVQDYILIDDTRTLKLATLTRNVAATTWGGEAGLSYLFGRQWKGDAALAYVRGTNDTDRTPLAQQPPLELRLALDYDDGVNFVGGLLRLVDGQDRVASGTGNIVGRDSGPTPGFAVFSLNGGYRPRKGVLVSAGVDNLFDKNYAEHLSRSGWMVAGYTQTVRVSEPGRTLWVKAKLALD